MVEKNIDEMTLEELEEELEKTDPEILKKADEILEAFGKFLGEQQEAWIEKLMNEK